MRCVTKATFLQFINGNKLKSCRTSLTNHTWPIIPHHITPLVINTLGGGHADRQTDTYTDARTKMIFWPRAPGLKRSHKT